MNRRPPIPLLIVALALSAGLLIQRITASAVDDWFWLASTFTLSVIVLVIRRRHFIRWVGILSLLACVAAINASFRANLGQNHIHWRLLQAKEQQITTATVAGRVVSQASRRNGRLTFEIDLVCLQGHASCPPIEGKIRVTIPDGDAVVGEGDGLVVSGRLKRPSLRRNPADFDFSGWLASRGIHGVLTHGQVLQHCPSTDAIRRLVQQVRSVIRSNIGHAIPERSQDLPLALLLGDRSRLATETRNDFARSGLMHLLAISGLHVMLVGMMFHRLMRPLLMRTGFTWQIVEGLRSSVTLLLLIVYAMVSGLGPSVVRAVIMTGFFLAGTVVRGISNPLNSMGGAASAILLFDPTALYQPGFQLSFSAVIGLLMLGRGVDLDLRLRARNGVQRWIISGVVTSLVATLATAPSLLYHFGYVGLAGILLNIIAIPIGAALLCSSILTCLVAFISPVASVPLGSAVDILGIILKWLAQIGGAPDTLVLSTSSVVSFSMSSLLILTALLTSLRGAPRRRLVTLSTFPPLASLFLSLVAGSYAPRLTMLFLDVGHGDAIIVRLPGGRILLSDAGNRHPFRDEGTRTVIPNLDEFDDDDVHLAVISHPHADHLGGLPSLLKKNVARCVADNGQAVDTKLYAEAMHLVEIKGSCHKALSAGDTLDLDPLVQILVLAPPPTGNMVEANDRSVVLKVVFGETSLLLTGDVEMEGEDFLSAQYCELLASDVVKVPHHGSRTSSTHDFIECVTQHKKPGHAVISVGSPLKYGLPDEEVLERWNRTQLDVHSTFEKGALWLESDGRSVRERRWDK